MADWKGKSKGSPLGYRFFIRIIQLFGVGFTYRILRFVTFYYYLFAKTPKRNLRRFYAIVPTVDPKRISKIIRKNFNYLGESIVDKFAFLIGKGDQITYTQEGENELQKFVDSGQPIVLISAHLGNWEIAGNFLKRLEAKVNVVMYDGERESLKRVIEDEVGDVHFNIIGIKNDMSHIFAISNAVRNGEVICIHGDRFMPEAKTITTNFFGKKVLLPYGPFQIAARLKAHHCFVFTIKNAKFNYHFTSTVPEQISSPEEIAAKYVKVLEEKVKENPEQWFNYHPFFEEDAH